MLASRGGIAPSPLDELKAIVEAVDIPVQAVGGLTPEQAVEMPLHGAPLVIDADAFKTNADDLESVLREVVRRIRNSKRQDERRI